MLWCSGEGSLLLLLFVSVFEHIYTCITPGTIIANANAQVSFTLSPRLVSIKGRLQRNTGRHRELSAHDVFGRLEESTACTELVVHVFP